MSTFPETESRSLGVGLVAAVLGTIGLFLFFLPILGLPISAFGLGFGISGVAMTYRRGGVALRWSLAGMVLSALALGINVALSYSPAGYLPSRDVPRSWQP